MLADGCILCACLVSPPYAKASSKNTNEQRRLVYQEYGKIMTREGWGRTKTMTRNKRKNRQGLPPSGRGGAWNIGMLCNFSASKWWNQTSKPIFQILACPLSSAMLLKHKCVGMSLENLVQMQILIPWVWGRVGFSFRTTPLGRVMLLVWEPHSW